MFLSNISESESESPHAGQGPRPRGAEGNQAEPPRLWPARRPKPPMHILPSLSNPLPHITKGTKESAGFGIKYSRDSSADAPEWPWALGRRS